MIKTDREKQMKGVKAMRTAIFTIDTESYEAKKKCGRRGLKRMLEQNRLEVKAAKVLPRR